MTMDDVIIGFRLLVIVVGAGFAGVLVQSARGEWPVMSNRDKAVFWTLLIYTVNVVLFVIVRFGLHLGVNPEIAWMYPGFLLSWAFGYRTLYLTRRLP